MKTIQNQIKFGVMAVLTLIAGFDAMNKEHNLFGIILLLGSIITIIGFYIYSCKEI